MRHSLAGTGVLLAALASSMSVQAEPLTWGQVDVSAGALRYGNLSGEAVNIVDRNPESLDLAGRLGADWGQIGAQLDLSYGAHSNNSTAGHHHNWGKQAALRVTYDISAATSLGAVYGLGESQPVADVGATFDFQAVEGAFTTGNWQVGLQIGQFDAVDAAATNAFHDGTFARAGVIYSLGSASAISANFGLFDGRQDGAPDTIVDMEAISVSVEYSRQIGDKPLAWSAGIESARYEKDGPEASTLGETRATLGLTAWFGDGAFGAAKGRTIFSQPDFGYLADTGNLID